MDAKKVALGAAAILLWVLTFAKASASPNLQSGGFCGADPAQAPSLVDKLFGVYAAEPQHFPANQCTGFVESRRPDVLQWIGERPADAYLWDDRARANGERYGVFVENFPRPGDVAVWEKGCDGADSRYGHVGYVIAAFGSSFRVEDANWKGRTTTTDIQVKSCMSFVRPINLILPSGISTGRGGMTFFDWLFGSLLDWLQKLF